jgi:hypothetical protein
MSYWYALLSITSILVSQTIYSQAGKWTYHEYSQIQLLTRDQALSGLEIPDDIKDQIVLIEVEFLDFSGTTKVGQLLVNNELKDEVVSIFHELLTIGFPIEKIVPISRYNWSDELSMLDNNTSCFNYRTIKGTRQLSHHAYGRAIDINPRWNPYISGGKVVPQNGQYDQTNKGTITPNSEVVSIFESYGWKWGGRWKNSKDYQHFYK